MKYALKFLSGAVAVYMIMAACGGGSSSSPNGSGGATGATGATASGVDASTQTDGNLAASTTAGSDGATDSMSPVPDASAQTAAGTSSGGSGSSAPQVDTVACDVELDGVLFAEKAYPGRSVADLAELRSVGVLTENMRFGTVTHQQQTAFLEDGVARVPCGIPSLPNYDSVLFVLP